ncbi:FtsW/RodA/SpoVE family cell cycle protein, partial [Salmonella enterica subsp. enterica serovar Kentucky]|nr:FtsW/RodA/SpoVE family cell cycle protein [Salmonella enterica subsp. enterica serovar Kentucky]
SGLSWRLIGVAIVLIAAFIPILWFFLMHDYQRQRVMMLLDPDFYKAINIGFPNAYDRAHGYDGKYLMIHGACVSVGCYAMTDSG